MTQTPHPHGDTRAVFFVPFAPVAPVMVVMVVALLTGAAFGFAWGTAAPAASAGDAYHITLLAGTATPRSLTATATTAPLATVRGRNFFAATSSDATTNDTGGNSTVAETTVARALTATAVVGSTVRTPTVAPTLTLSAAARTAVAGSAGSASTAAAAAPATATPVPTATATATTAPATTTPTTSGTAGGISGGTSAATTAPMTPAATVAPVPTLGPTAAPITDAADIYAKVSPAVVMVVNPAQRRPGSHTAGVATGLIYDVQGYIVTAGGIVAGAKPGELAKQVDVVFANERRVQATVIGRDDATNLAVVKIDPTAVPGTVALGDGSGLRVGQAVVAIGSPMEFAASVTRGVISGINRPVGERSGLIQTSAATSSGVYGGPLVDGTGTVVGIVTVNIHDDETQRIGFAVPGNRAKVVVAALVQSGKVVRPSLGATAEMLTPGRAVALGLSVNAGAYLSSVIKDGPGEKGGLLPGDVITAVNGTPVTNAAPLADALAALAPKASVMLTVNRAGAVQQVTVTLGDG